MRISRSLRLTTLWRSARAEDLHCFPVVTWLKLDPGASQKSVEMDPNLTCEAEWEKDASTEFERQMGHSAMAQETSRNWVTPYLSYLGRNPTLNASSYAILLLLLCSIFTFLLPLVSETPWGNGQIGGAQLPLGCRTGCEASGRRSGLKKDEPSTPSTDVPQNWEKCWCSQSTYVAYQN